MEKEKGYTGENKKWILFNEKIVINRTLDDGQVVPYLIRRTILGISKYFSIKHHKIVQSDEICSHDHPWPFLTFILKGGYYEWTPETQKERGKILQRRVGPDGITEVRRWHGPGSVMYRPAAWRHQLELKDIHENDPESEPRLLPATTLVFTGTVIRKWGFFTKHGWLYWRNYKKEEHC